MMADSTGKVTSGAPFKPPPATIWNNMIDAGRAFADGKLASGSPGATRPRATDLLKLKNSSGAVRRKGEILKIEGKVIETVTDESIWLDGIEPTTDCRFGILKSPADVSEVVTAQVSGVCVAVVNVTDESHTFAAAADADYVLQSESSGPLEILYAPAGTGELDCVVRFGGTPGLTPYILTATYEGGYGDALMHRCSNPVTGQRCEVAWTGDGNDRTVDLSHLQGVTGIGCIVWCSSAFGSLYALSGGQASSMLLSCVAAEEILAGTSGEVTVTYLDADNAGRTATLSDVPNDTGMVIPDGTAVYVAYDSLNCLFSIYGIRCSG